MKIGKPFDPKTSQSSTGSPTKNRANRGDAKKEQQDISKSPDVLEQADEAQASKPLGATKYANKKCPEPAASRGNAQIAAQVALIDQAKRAIIAAKKDIEKLVSSFERSLNEIVIRAMGRFSTPGEIFDGDLTQQLFDYSFEATKLLQERVISGLRSVVEDVEKKIKKGRHHQILDQIHKFTLDHQTVLNEASHKLAKISSEEFASTYKVDLSPIIEMQKNLLRVHEVLKEMADCIKAHRTMMALARSEDVR